MTGAYFYERHVRVRGIIKEATSVDLELKLDEFKKRLSVQEAELAIKVNGSVRTVNATLANPDQMLEGREGYHISVCPFELDFICAEPLFTALEYTAETLESIASLIYPTGINNAGTYKAPMVAIAVIEAASGLTGISVKNDTNGEILTLTKALGVGDVITIDGEAKSVKVNGVECDYDGTFPALETDDNTIRTTFVGTSVQYTLTIKHKNAYL
jgi:phage-related protein